MKQLKTLLIISGLLILFVGNIGVNVFKHICKEDGVWTSYFVKTSDDHCEKKAKVLNHVKSCCSKEEKKEKDGCCNDQTEYFKIKLDFFNDPSIVVPHLSAVIIPSHFEFVYSESKKEYFSKKYINPPPKKAGRDILTLHQVFII